MSIMNIKNYKYSHINGFIVSLIIIQLLLCCCIGPNNKPQVLTTCDALTIAFSNFANILIMIPYILMHIPWLKQSPNSFHFIYLIIIIINTIVTVFIINSYYLSESSFQEYFCKLYRPQPPELPTISLPSIKEIKILPYTQCSICCNNTHKINTLTCSHKLCSQCIETIKSTNNKCPFCKAILNI